MFKIDDTVVCIKPWDSCLTVNKKYIVLGVKLSGYISVIDDNNEQNTFNYEMFCSLSDIRDKKLEKLLKKV